MYVSVYLYVIIIIIMVDAVSWRQLNNIALFHTHTHSYIVVCAAGIGT